MHLDRLENLLCHDRDRDHDLLSLFQFVPGFPGDSEVSA
jgi:hypothetical protein